MNDPRELAEDQVPLLRNQQKKKRFLKNYKESDQKRRNETKRIFGHVRTFPVRSGKRFSLAIPVFPAFSIL